jgi:hypothetical protein
MIPGWMPEYELTVIEDLARRVRPGGVIVEVGPFCGRSSWCWAKSADPSVQVNCLDPWNPTEHPYHPPIGKDADADIGLFGTADHFVEAMATFENFRRYTADCPNIVPHQGASPDAFLDWPLASVDLVFLDGLHHNPGFHKDLWFWWKRLKPGGIYCGDDYARTHPDVIFTVRDMTAELGLNMAVKGRIWIMQKPLEGDDPDRNAGPRLTLDL